MPRDRVALVTGGSRGLGLAVADRLALDMEVITCARSGAVTIRADVSEPTQVDHMVRNIENSCGRIDVLVCNAGVYRGSWRDMIATNLYGTILCVEAVLPMMLRWGSGKIITLSGAGVGGPPAAGLGVYAATKAGIVQYTESRAVDLQGYGITINAVAPGLQETDDQRQRAVDCIAWLASPASDGITGRLISAARDDWPNLASTYLADDRFRLRRVIS